MPGRDALGAHGHGVVEERLELDLGVAEHVRVRRAARAVLGEEAREDALAVLRREVHGLDLDAHLVGHGHRVDEILARGAVLVVVVVLPVLHEEADHVVALPLEQQRGDGRIDTSGEPDDDFHGGVSCGKSGRAGEMKKAGPKPCLSRCGSCRDYFFGASFFGSAFVASAFLASSFFGAAFFASAFFAAAFFLVDFFLACFVVVLGASAFFTSALAGASAFARGRPAVAAVAGLAGSAGLAGAWANAPSETDANTAAIRADSFFISDSFA